MTPGRDNLPWDHLPPEEQNAASSEPQDGRSTRDGHSAARVDEGERVFILLWDRNLAPGDVPHWSAVWEDAARPGGARERCDRFLDAQSAITWGRARAPHVYVRTVEQEFWAGLGPPPDGTMACWDIA